MIIHVNKYHWDYRIKCVFFKTQVYHQLSQSDTIGYHIKQIMVVHTSSNQYATVST